MAQNSNESSSAWPWNYACLMLTLETQLNSSVLNQSGAAWMNMHFDWVSGNHNLLSRAVWQPPAVQHLTCGSLQSFCFYYGWYVLVDHKLSHSEMRWAKLFFLFFFKLFRLHSLLYCFIIWTTDGEAVCICTTSTIFNRICLSRLFSIYSKYMHYKHYLRHHIYLRWMWFTPEVAGECNHWTEKTSSILGPCGPTINICASAILKNVSGR